MAKYIIVFFFATLSVISCGTDEEGFTGDWTGTRSIIGPNGEDATLSIIARIGALENMERNIALNDGENTYDFEVEESGNTLTFDEVAINNQPSDDKITYIDGTAEMIQDTILRFSYEVKVLQGSALVSSESLSFDTTKDE